MDDTVRLFADAWKTMTGRLPSTRIVESGGVMTCFANVPLIFLNVSVVLQPANSPEELRGLLKIVTERASLCPHPSGALVREDWMPTGWEAILAEYGLASILPMTGMEASEVLPPRRTAPAALEIRRVTNDAEGRDLATVNAHAYQIPVELFESIANKQLWQEDSIAFVGYENGQPVSSAGAFPVDGTVYIALVATMPEAQGKGYAEAIVRHTIAEAQRRMGYPSTTLHATDMGLPVYKAIGYRPGPRLIFLGPAH